MTAPRRVFQSASIFANGSAYDRQQPKDDHNPLANLLNFEDIGTDVEKAGSIIKQVLDGILNGIPAAILELTGLDFSSPEAFVTSLITVITTGGPALVWAGALLDMIGQALGFPPGAFAGLMQFIPSLFGGLDLTHIGSLTPAAAWATVVSTLIKPLNLLAPLNGFGFLPDANRPQMLQDSIDHIFNAWDSGVPGNTTGNPLSQLFSAVFGINRTGTGAQSQNVVQDAQIGALLQGSANPLFDTFDGPQVTVLPSARWRQTYSGSGGGTYGLSGSGSARWNTSGASTRRSQNLYIADTLDTDTQGVSITLAANLGSSLVGQHPQVLLRGRVNAADNTAVEAQIQPNSVTLGYYVAGAFTALGPALSISGDTSGTWTLKLGTTSSAREFILLHNNVTVLTRAESGTASQLGASYRNVGFSVTAGVQWIPATIIFFQLAPPDVEAFGATDRLAAL